jgi:hypothetical protein
MDTSTFIQRLNETISWCSSQELIGDPDKVEDESIRQRRLMASKAAELIGAGYRVLWQYERTGWLSRWKARAEIRHATEMKAEGEKLRALADPGSIAPPLRQQLRSEALRRFAQFLAQPRANRTKIVDQVAEARSHLLHQSGKFSDPQSLDLYGGQLLLYAPEENLACGAAEYVSLGFFDVDNVPPWDTWIAMSGKYLISWVPAQLFRLVQEGLDVNPEQCILWADDPLLAKEPLAAMLGQLTSKVA